MIRPMRGQVVVREEPRAPSATLWTPDPTPRQVRTHTGRVLALGPPARTAGGVEVPHDYQVGDLIQYHFEHLEQLLTNTWPEDGLPATWVPQTSVDAVWCEPCELCSGAGHFGDEDGVANGDLCEQCDGTGDQVVHNPQFPPEFP